MTRATAQKVVSMAISMLIQMDRKKQLLSTRSLRRGMHQLVLPSLILSAGSRLALYWM